MTKEELIEKLEKRKAQTIERIQEETDDLRITEWLKGRVSAFNFAIALASSLDTP